MNDSITELAALVADLEKEHGQRPKAFLITPADLRRLEVFCKVKASKVDGIGWATASVLGIPLIVDPNAPPGRPFPLYDWPLLRAAGVLPEGEGP